VTIGLGVVDEVETTSGLDGVTGRLVLVKDGRHARLVVDSILITEGGTSGVDFDVVGDAVVVVVVVVVDVVVVVVEDVVGADVVVVVVDADVLEILTGVSELELAMGLESLSEVKGVSVLLMTAWPKLAVDGAYSLSVKFCSQAVVPLARPSSVMALVLVV
jgi:hypothetical protein